MSRWDSDVDHDEWLNGPDVLTGLCDDCGDAYVTRADDVSPWCPACARERERWAAAKEAGVPSVTSAVVRPCDDVFGEKE